MEVSDGVGKGTKVYGVMVGLRTFPNLEKPGGGGPDGEGGSEDDEGTLVAGGSDSVVDGKKLEF